MAETQLTTEYVHASLHVIMVCAYKYSLIQLRSLFDISLLCTGIKYNIDFPTTVREKLHAANTTPIDKMCTSTIHLITLVLVERVCSFAKHSYNL